MRCPPNAQKKRGKNSHFRYYSFYCRQNSKCRCIAMICTQFFLLRKFPGIDFMKELFMLDSKLYTPSTLNIDLILWHTQLIVCAENVKSWFKSWVFPFTFQAYLLPHALNCMCVSLFKFHI